MASGFQGGIITRGYKSGSIIYFEGDKSEYIYILKSGRVLLTYTKIDTGEEVKEEVRQGEFFGVKSALGKYPREETAQTIGETSVLVLNMADFERMILRNVNVVRKMLRVFSNQLRRLGKTVRTVLGETDNVNPDVELFRIGEHYFKSGDFNKATYAFKKYMEYYPNTDYSKLAMDRIKAISSGGGIPQGKPVKPAKDDDLADFSMDDDSEDVFSFEDKPSPKKEVKPDFSFDSEPHEPALSSELSSEMDDFLSDDNTLDEFGDFGLDSNHSAKSEPTIKEKFDGAVASLKTDNYKSALEVFSEIIRDGLPEKQQDKKIFIESYFYTGVCYFNLKNYKNAMTHFAEIVKKYSDSERMKESLLYIGEIFEAAGQKDKAITYYNKVANASPKDSLNSKAFDKIRALQKS
ncbi:MAG TPA: tetratricopeptide repeat protein [Spirochaetota bacterium]|nr:tetratricopeptide repeat protein [Spirochaetota bacterium]HPS85157.1 tetratricopeptide repeat protein [Spirochaetota bacterium]